MQKNLLVFTVIICVVFVLFWQFFLKGLHPFPGNYMLAWYEPWKTNYTIEQTITIPHKPVADDTFRYLYPFKLLAIDSLKNLEFPLWNPYNGSGMPLLATYQSGFFNPLNILFIFLSPQTAWSIYIIAQAILLSLFTYLYCRKIRLSSTSSVFATAVFLFSGFVVARLIFGNIIYPLATLPLILYLIEDYLVDKRSKKILLLPFVVAFMLLSGHPHPMIYVIIFSFSYFVYRVFSISKIREKIIRILFFVLLFSVGVGIASIQTIPTLELLRHSNMNPESSEFIFNRFLLPMPHLISIIFPNYYGNQATYNYWGAGDYVETVASMGTISVFFAYFGLFNQSANKKKYQTFFFIASLISIILTLDWILPKFLSTLPLPILSTSPPSRIFAITSFSIAILAGYGFDKWIGLKKVSRALLYQTAVFVLLLIALLIGTFILFKTDTSCNNQFIIQCRLVALRNTILETSFFIPMIVSFFIYLVSRNKIVRYAPFLIIFLVLILGLYNSNKFLPFSEKNTILKEHPLFAFLKSQASIDRVFGLGEANIKTNLATHFRFFDPNYFDPLHNKRYAEVVAFANNESISNLSRSDIEITTEINLAEENGQRRDRLLNLLGVGFLIFKKSEVNLAQNDNVVWQNENWYILKNEDTLPRSYIVNNFEIFSSSKDLLNRLFDPSFDPSKTVLLEEKPTSYSSSTSMKLRVNSSREVNNVTMKQLNNYSSRQARTVNLISYESNSVLIKTDTISDALLILSDNYYPGWKAYVYPEGNRRIYPEENRRIDGKETKIYRANYTFRAIEVPAGEHIVEFSYKPVSFKIGLALSIFSIVVYIAIIAFLKRGPKSND